MKKKQVVDYVKQYALIIAGAVLYAAGFQLFFYPNDIIVGGVTGISMIINYLTGFPVGVMIMIINVPLFVIAWRHFGFGFLVGSLVAMGLSSTVVDLLALTGFSATDDQLLACLYGGMCTGVGLGLIYLAGATTGGVDIIAKFVKKRMPHMNFGTIILIMDVIVIAAFAVVFNQYKSAMYAIIGMVVDAKGIDLMLYGTNSSKMCFIISDKYEEIQAAISKTLDRGVTYLEGEGAYTGNPKKVIYCVIKKRQLAGVRKIIRDIDHNAFFAVTDSRDVFGDGFGNILADDV